MKHTNVLLVSHFSNLSGAPISLSLLARHLKDYGYNPFLSIPSRGPLEKLLKKLEIPYFITGHLGSVFSLRKLIVENNIKLVHANTIIAAPAAVLSRLMGKKLVWHIREDVSGNKIMVKVIERLSDKIIILSESMKAPFNSKFYKKIEIVHNGVDLEDFKEISKAEKDSLREKLQIKNKKSVAVIGTIEPRKGQEQFIKAIENMKDLEGVKYLIIGKPLPGQKRYFRSLKKYCREKDLPVVFVPARTDIPEVLQVIDLVCVPSLSEPFGRVVIEAMAAGKPVIGADTGGIPEIIDDNTTGVLVKPGSIDELEKAMRKLLSEDKVRHAMGEKGLRRVREHFTIQSYVSNIVEIYKEVLSNE